MNTINLCSSSLLRGLYLPGTGEALERANFWLDVLLSFSLQSRVIHVSNCEPSLRLPVLYVWCLLVQSDALGFGESLMLLLCDLNKPCCDSDLLAPFCGLLGVCGPSVPLAHSFLALTSQLQVKETHRALRASGILLFLIQCLG